MNFFAALCQRSKELWIRMLAECEQRQSNELIGTCYNHSSVFIEIFSKFEVTFRFCSSFLNPN